jgi:hypothetical protein
MKKLGKLLGWILVALVVVLVVGITFTIGWRPFIGPRARALTARKFESTPARLARGEYLVNAVADCMLCHAQHDWAAHDAPLVSGTLGSGQDMNLLKGLPGQVFAPNITPDAETGVGSWSDDQLARAIREGVGHDGRALFPFMPYPDYRVMSDEDLASVVVYLRSLPPIRKQRPATNLIFPVKYLIRSVPQPLDTPVPEADLSTPEKHGAYRWASPAARIAIRPRTLTASRCPAWIFPAATFWKVRGAAWPAPTSRRIRRGSRTTTRRSLRKPCAQDS